jgi:hypothetical protein
MLAKVSFSPAAGVMCAALLLLAATIRAEPATSAPQCRRDLTYDQVQQKSIHSAYLMAESLMDPSRRRTHRRPARWG